MNIRGRNRLGDMAGRRASSRPIKSANQIKVSGTLVLGITELRWPFRCDGKIGLACYHKGTTPQVVATDVRIILFAFCSLF
jgi:hypothetical protein